MRKPLVPWPATQISSGTLLCIKRSIRKVEYLAVVESQKEISMAKKGIDWSRNPLSHNVLSHYFHVPSLQVSAKWDRWKGYTT